MRASLSSAGHFPFDTAQAFDVIFQILPVDQIFPRGMAGCDFAFDIVFQFAAR
jgi:hypothetical protein